MAITLADLRTKVRQRADIESDTVRHTDAELNGHINDGAKELYALAHKYGVLRAEKENTITADGSASYALPADFYATIGVWLKKDQYSIRLKRHGIATRPFEGPAPTGTSDFASSYRVAFYNGVYKMELYPRATTGSFAHVYVPLPTELVNDADELTIFTGILGWEDFIVLDAAIKVLMKDDLPYNTHAAERAKIEARIAEEAELREFTQAQMVFDGRRSLYYDPGDIRHGRSGDNYWVWPYRGW